MPTIRCGVPGCSRPLHRIERCYLHFVQYRAKSPHATPEDIIEYEVCFGPARRPVYAVLADTDAAVKFGVSSDPHTRMSSLQNGNPHDLRLLGQVDGGREVERKIFKALEKYRLRGEWFRYTGPVKTVAAAISSNNSEALMEALRNFLPPS